MEVVVVFALTIIIYYLSMCYKTRYRFREDGKSLTIGATLFLPFYLLHISKDENLGITRGIKGRLARSVHRIAKYDILLAVFLVIVEEALAKKERLTYKECSDAELQEWYKSVIIDVGDGDSFN